MGNYAEFLQAKAQLGGLHGFAPVVRPAWLYDFQTALLDWAIRKGRAAIFADCGLGKTPMQLVWAQNIVEHTNGSVLILTPLAVSAQTVREGAKFGIECHRSLDGHRPTRIVVTNYERLHYFNPTDFAGVVCDESSILKHFSGATQKQVTRFLLKVPYRLLCTATAAPNDYIELGTSSEALGELGYSEMLTRFFKQDDKKPHRLEDIKQWRMARDPDHFAKLAFRVSQQIGQWRLKGHAVTPFWRWMASWARACRKPSDLGFADASFLLPPLQQRDHIVVPKSPGSGLLFVRPAVGLAEERDERRRTLDERCRLVADLVNDDQPAVIWCHLNVEGNTLARIIPGSVQVKGADSDSVKETAYLAFAAGDIRVLITKPVIGAWGLNWQQCAHVVTFASHSYEQFYQSVRRCWRFGQRRPVTVDVISTEGEVHVRNSMMKKAEAADVMFAQLVQHMRDATHIAPLAEHDIPVMIPTWVS
jgi:hypothetical protein